MLYSARLKEAISSSILILAAGIFLNMPAVAEENSLEIYPLPAVFGSKSNPSSFNKLLGSRRDIFVNTFTDVVKQNFDNTVSEFSDKSKYKTFVAYMSIPRVSENKYQRKKLVDIFLPLTASIHFVNAATGEMLYSYPLTSVAKYETNTEEADSSATYAKIEELYLQSYQNLTEKIINNAAKEFKPFSIVAVVSDTYRGLYILDKGSSAGIAKGDLLTDDRGNQINVIFSDLGYSVAEKVIGNINAGANFTKYAIGNIAQLKKPKILFVNDLKDEKSYGIFAAAAGNTADFSLITVDKTFYDMQEALVSLNDGFKAANMNNRTMPDYFMKLHIGNPVYTRYPTNKDYGFLDKYNLTVCGSIFDKTGRTVFVRCADDEISVQTVSDIKFTDEAQFDVLTKNALVKLADIFAKEIKLKQGNLKIIKAGGDIINVEDANEMLSIGNTVSVFRKIKTEQKGKEVVIPIWEYKVYEHNGKEALCKQIQPLIDGMEKISNKDIVIAGTLGKSNTQLNIFRYDPIKTTLKDNEIVLNDFEKISFFTLAFSVNIPVMADGKELDEIIAELNSGYGFKQKLIIPSSKDNLTIRTAYKIEFVKEKLTGNLLSQEYKITLGVMTKNGEEVLKQKGMTQNIHIQVPAQDNKEIRDYELSKAVYALIQQVGKDI
jgi:hypothetical protein